MTQTEVPFERLLGIQIYIVPCKKHLSKRHREHLLFGETKGVLLDTSENIPICVVHVLDGGRLNYEDCHGQFWNTHIPNLFLGLPSIYYLRH